MSEEQATGTYDQSVFEFISKDEFDDLIEEGLDFTKVLSIEQKRRKKAKALEESYKPDVYPALTKEEWLKHVKDGARDEKLQKINEEKRAEIDKRMKKYNYGFDAGDNIKYYKEEEVRIVVLGKTGEGKSAVGNTVLGSKYFQDELSGHSVTKSTTEASTKWRNIKIRLIDTPGLQDTDMDKEDIMSEIARIVWLFPKGVHAFLYVLNISTRFTKAEKEVLDDIKDQFGKDVLKYTVLVYTHADGTPDLDLFRHVSDEKNTPGPYKDFLQELDWKVLAVNNKATILYEKQHNQSCILSHVIQMVQGNAPLSVYTNELFDEAQRQRKLRRKNELMPPLFAITHEYIRMHPEVLKESRVPDQLLQIVKKDCKEARSFSDSDLLVEVMTEINNVRIEQMQLKTKVKQTIRGDRCTIL